MKIKILIIILCFPTLSVGQMYNTEIFENIISNNILLYRLLEYKSVIKSTELNGDYFKRNKDYFSFVLPDNNKCRLVLKFTETKMYFPDTNFKIYEVENNYIYNCEGALNINNYGPFQGSEKYFVAINAKTDELLFLSGHFYLSDVYKSYYDKDEFCFKEYLKLMLLPYYDHIEIKHVDKGSRTGYAIIDGSNCKLQVSISGQMDIIYNK